MTKRTAVVIDDEVDITNYLSSILETHDFEVRTANDARSGELLVRESPPDVILLDLMMPGRSGVQLFAKLRGDEATRGIPMVMVTGIKDQTGMDWGATVDQLKARRPEGFIEKPIDPERLIQVVDAVLAGEAKDEIVHG
jgi:CheY-like chemotaxis protein